MEKINHITRYIVALAFCFLGNALGSQQIRKGLEIQDIHFANRTFADHEINDAIDVAIRESRTLIGLTELKGNRGKQIDEFNRLVKAPIGSPWCASVQFYADVTSIICRTTVRSGSVVVWSNSTSPLVKVWDRKWRSKGKTPFVKCGCKFTIYFANLGRDAHIGMIDEVSADSIEVYTGEGNTTDIPGAIGSSSDREGRIYTRKKRRVDSISKVMCPIEFLTHAERMRFVYNK